MIIIHISLLIDTTICCRPSSPGQGSSSTLGQASLGSCTHVGTPATTLISRHLGHSHLTESCLCTKRGSLSRAGRSQVSWLGRPSEGGGRQLALPYRLGAVSLAGRRFLAVPSLKSKTFGHTVSREVAMPTAARRRRSGLRQQGFIPVIFFGSLLILLLFVTIHTHNLASLTTDCLGTSESRIHQLRPSSNEHSLDGIQRQFVNNANLDDACDMEYKRVTRQQTPGITKDDLARSQAHLGNRFRLTEVMKVLTARNRPVNIVVAGGSISLGHGVTPDSARYAERLESWMNQEYPLASGQHGVLNVAAHGADMCGE